MIELKIADMKAFLNLVNACRGEISILYPDGKKENLRKNYAIQLRLIREWLNNQRLLTISLETSKKSDGSKLSRCLTEKTKT